jgi:hypothetical protein
MDVVVFGDAGKKEEGKNNNNRALIDFSLNLVPMCFYYYNKILYRHRQPRVEWFGMGILGDVDGRRAISKKRWSDSRGKKQESAPRGVYVD